MNFCFFLYEGNDTLEKPAFTTDNITSTFARSKAVGLLQKFDKILTRWTTTDLQIYTVEM